MKKPELLIIGIDGACPGYIKKAAKEGRLPNYRRLMERGVLFDDHMPAFPSITPTCWSSISCGAVPSVTGALCHQVHIDGTHPTKYVTPYNSANVRAERFWEAAARVGKRSLIIDVPGSGPAKCDGVLQVMGGNTYSPDRCPADSYKSGVPQQIFTNCVSGAGAVDYFKTRAGSWEPIEGGNAYSETERDVFAFSPVYSDERYDKDEVESHEWIIATEADGVRIGTDREDAAERPVTHEGEWTEVITRRFMTKDGVRVPFHFRARLDSFDKATREFKVSVSAARNMYKEITPLSFAREIAEIPEVFAPDYSSVQPRHCTLDKFFESERYAFRWTRAVIKHALEHYEPDIVFLTTRSA